MHLYNFAVTSQLGAKCNAIQFLRQIATEIRQNFVDAKRVRATTICASEGGAGASADNGAVERLGQDAHKSFEEMRTRGRPVSAQDKRVYRSEAFRERYFSAKVAGRAASVVLGRRVCKSKRPAECTRSKYCHSRGVPRDRLLATSEWRKLILFRRAYDASSVSHDAS
jgi:hypothetical protein